VTSDPSGGPPMIFKSHPSNRSDMELSNTDSIADSGAEILAYGTAVRLQ